MNLKSKTTGPDNFPTEFAYLISPSEPVSNNEELYASVKRNGRAVLRPFKGFTFDLMTPMSITPEEFEEKWEGD